jgi:hypothetical protein
VQAFASLVQGVPTPFLPSAGQVVEKPSHASALSHSPPAARQTAPPLPAGCWQSAEPPLHWSTVHGFESVEHAVATGLKVSAGQFGPFPGQFSALSHSPAAARH